MKKLLFFVVAAVLALVVFNYVKTGTIRIIPAKPAPASQQLDRLSEQFHALVREYNNAGRAASVSGLDTSYDAGAVRIKVLTLKQETDELAVKITNPAVKEDAQKLQAEMEHFLQQMQ